MKLVYLSPVPWQSISQRPHFFVQQALAQGISEVLWVEPYPGRLPVWQDLIPSRHAIEPAGLDALPGLTVIGQRLLPVEPFAVLFNGLNGRKLAVLQRQINDFTAGEPAMLVIGKPSRLALRLLAEPNWQECWFDAMDNYAAFYQGLSRNSMAQLEQAVVLKVDKLLCSSHALADKFASHPNIHLYLNATADYMAQPVSAEPLSIGSAALCFGYIGTISQWFDWQWVIALAEQFPTATIKLIGPLKVLKPRDLPANIQLLPAVAHTEVPALLASFNAGLVPFLVNEITRYVDPVKYYEYAAAGLPVLSSEFGEMPWHAANSPSVYMAALPKHDDITAFLAKPVTAHEVTWQQRFAGLFEC
ncbi:glycosyl transferase [Oceanisphaera sp. IT1-181]|uniref:glycosyl transferase n=1 Tax=Oceanisphaera sp. IT1-181 TaxID=3081199 RepID=UPI0029CA8393|nr:glycosyl transferase [Oceanisphaera sp. IT1-181]